MKTILAVALISLAVSSLHAESDTSNNLSIRREMLQWHQIAGLTTLGLWLATNLVGEQALHSLHRKAEPTANAVLLLNPQQNYPLYYSIMQNSEWKATRGQGHRGLAAATFGAYAITGSLALFAPGRIKESAEFDSISAHKLLAVVHLSAMLSLPVIGRRIEHKGPSAARTMQRVGWGGFGAMGLSVVALYF